MQMTPKLTDRLYLKLRREAAVDSFLKWPLLEAYMGINLKRVKHASLLPVTDL